MAVTGLESALTVAVRSRDGPDAQPALGPPLGAWLHHSCIAAASHELSGCLWQADCVAHLLDQAACWSPDSRVSLLYRRDGDSCMT